MEREHPVGQSGAAPPSSATFLWSRLAVWLPACVFLGVVVAWASVVAQEYSAPLVLFPLLVGVGLGALAVAVMRLAQVGHRPTVFLGLGLAVIVTVVGQHYLGYRLQVEETRRSAEKYLRASALFPEVREEESPVPPSEFGKFMRWQAARGRPLGIGGYVARGGVAWLTWALDAGLLAAAAFAMVLPAVRQPYCNGCRSWYRTTRSGRLSGSRGVELGQLAGVEIPEQPAWVRFRLIHCASGCGPTGLRLFWESANGDAADAAIWLTPELRNQITGFLDRLLEENGPRRESRSDQQQITNDQ